MKKINETDQTVNLVVQQLDQQAEHLDKKTLDSLAESRKIALQHAHSKAEKKSIGVWKPVAAFCSLAFIFTIAYIGLTQDRFGDDLPLIADASTPTSIELLLVSDEDLAIALNDLDFYAWAIEES